MGEVIVSQKVEQVIEYKGDFSACHISLASDLSQSNSAFKVLTVSGQNFNDCEIKKMEHGGFQLSFQGDWEEKDLINFFVQVAYQRGILKKPETKKKVTRKRQPKKLIPEMKQENV